MIAWATDPSAMETEIDSYHALVENSRRELSFVQSETERWTRNFELARHKVIGALAESKQRNQQLGDDARIMLDLCQLEMGKNLEAHEGSAEAPSDVGTLIATKKRGASSQNPSSILHKVLQELQYRQEIFGKCVREYEQLVSASSLVDINAAPVISITLDDGSSGLSGPPATTTGMDITTMLNREEEKMMSRVRGLHSWLPSKDESIRKKRKKTSSLFQPLNGAEKAGFQKMKQRKDMGKEEAAKGKSESKAGESTEADPMEGDDDGGDDWEDDTDANEGLEALSEIIFAIQESVRDAESSLYDLGAFFPDDDAKGGSKGFSEKEDEGLPEYHGIFGKSVLQQYGLRLVKKGERVEAKPAVAMDKVSVKAEGKQEKGRGKGKGDKKKKDQQPPMPKDPSKAPPRLFDYTDEYSVVPIPSAISAQGPLVIGKDQESQLAKDVLGLKTETQWAQHLENVCRAPTNSRRKRKGVSQAVSIPLLSHPSSRTPTGLPLLVSPLSQYEDRFVGVMSGKQIGRPVPHTKEKMDKVPYPAKEDERELGYNACVEEARVQNPALLPPELEEAENTIMNYCQLVSHAAAMETDIRKLMNTASEWRKQASEVSYNTLWSEKAYQQVQMEDYTETRLNRKELIANGRFEGDNSPMSPIRSGSFLHIPGVPIKGYAKAGHGNNTKKKFVKAPSIPGQKSFYPPGAAAAMKQHVMASLGVGVNTVAGAGVGVQTGQAGIQMPSGEGENGVGVSNVAGPATMVDEVMISVSDNGISQEDDDVNSVVSLAPSVQSTNAAASDLVDNNGNGIAAAKAEGAYSSDATTKESGDRIDDCSVGPEGEADDDRKGRRGGVVGKGRKVVPVKKTRK
jgi:hypothetical protein